MAPKTEKVRRENAQVAAFIEKLYRAGGFKSWGDFGRQAGGIPSPTMSDWKRGENAPSGYNLMRLIRATERHNEYAMMSSALMTDPLVALGVRIAIEIARGETAEPGEELVSLMKRVREGSGVAAEAREERGLDARLEAISERVEQTRQLVVEGLGLQDRARELEAELQPAPGDLPKTEAEDG